MRSRTPGTAGPAEPLRGAAPSGVIVTTPWICRITSPLPPYEFPKEAKAPAEVLKRVDIARDTRGYDPAKDDRIMTGRP